MPHSPVFLEGARIFGVNPGCGPEYARNGAWGEQVDLLAFSDWLQEQGYPGLCRPQEAHMVEYGPYWAAQYLPGEQP